MLLPTGPLVPDVERIAVLRANGIGDVVLALPALAALRAAYPRASVTHLGAPWHAQLLEGRPGPWDSVVVVPPYPGVRDAPGASRSSAEVEGFLAAQRRERYDLAVQLHGGGGNSNPFVSALGARVTAGSCDVGAPPLDRWARYTLHQHEVHRCLEVVALVGAPPVELDPRLEVTAGDRAAADEALARRPGLPAGAGPLVGIHPGATDPRRRWPAGSFAAVARALAGRGAQVVLVGHGGDDERAAAEVAAGWPASVPAPLDLVGSLSMSALVGVLERCALVVADDSGPRHVAAAVGTATVGVYQSGNAINAAPLTRTRHRIAVSFRDACPICGAEQARTRCPHDPSFVADVAVEEVLALALDLLEG